MFLITRLRIPRAARPPLLWAIKCRLGRHLSGGRAHRWPGRDLAGLCVNCRTEYDQAVLRRWYAR